MRYGGFFKAAALLAAVLTLGLGEARAQETLAVTYVKAPLNIPSILERRLGLLDAAFSGDVTVTYPELTAGPQQTQALAAGDVDIAHCLGSTSALLAAAGGVDLRIVGIYSRAPEAFVLLVPEGGVASVAELKGRKVAGPKGTVLHQLLVSALRREGLSPTDVTFVPMGIPESTAALAGGAVDAALAAGPAVPKALAAGARVLVTGKGLLDATTVIAARGELLRNHPERVARFLEIHRQAVDLLATRPEEAFRVTAEEVGLSEEEVGRMAALYDFDPTIRSGDVEELRKTRDFLFENGLLTEKIEVETLLER